jgi:hypothetical protein
MSPCYDALLFLVSDLRLLILVKIFSDCALCFSLNHRLRASYLPKIIDNFKEDSQHGRKGWCGRWAAEVQYRETNGVQQRGKSRLYGHGHVELAMRLITDESYVSSSYFLDVDNIIIDYNLSWK